MPATARDGFRRPTHVVCIRVRGDRCWVRVYAGYIGAWALARRASAFRVLIDTSSVNKAAAILVAHEQHKSTSPGQGPVPLNLTDSRPARRSSMPRRQGSTRGLDASMLKLDASMLFEVEAMICRVKDEASTPESRDTPRRTSTRLDAPRRASTHHLDVPRRTSTLLDTLDAPQRFLIRVAVLDMLEYTINP